MIEYLPEDLKTDDPTYCVQTFQYTWYDHQNLRFRPLLVRDVLGHPPVV